jgi:hypothetical protein
MSGNTTRLTMGKLHVPVMSNVRVRKLNKLEEI